MSREDHDLLDRYLAELGVDAAPPSPEALVALHRAHVQRFAHDTVWIARERLPCFEQRALAEALVDGEGGGCFQLNVGLQWLLQALGYAAELHGARIQRAFDREPGERRDGHVVLLVHLPDGTWYADAGLGNGLLEPVPLVAGAFEQEGGFRYALEPSTTGGSSWAFHHDRSLLALRLVELEAQPSPLACFADGFVHDATDPASPFRLHVSANRRRVDGVSSLTGNVLVRRGAGGRSMTRLQDAEEWEAVLREEFLLGLPGWTTAERDLLWARVSGRV